MSGDHRLVGELADLCGPGLAGRPLSGGEPVVLEDSLNAPGARGADALIDAQGVPQVDDGLAGVTIDEAGLAESF